jgi:hypothetical protein
VIKGKDAWNDSKAFFFLERKRNIMTIVNSGQAKMTRCIHIQGNGPSGKRKRKKKLGGKEPKNVRKRDEHRDKIFLSNLALRSSRQLIEPAKQLLEPASMAFGSADLSTSSVQRTKGSHRKIQP